MSNAFNIDWNNLPPCTGEIVISPHVCIDDSYVPPEVTVNEVPAPNALLLMVLGLAALIASRRQR